MSISANGLDGSNGFKVAVGGSAASVSGDFNGDGFDDLIIGSAGTDQTFVVFGRAGGFAPVLDAASIAGANGFVVDGVTAGDQCGFAVAFAGDINGDGYGDMAIGAPFVDVNGITDAGSVYVVYGGAGGFNSPFNLSSLDGGNGFVLTGEQRSSRAGFSLDEAGDFNADGIADFLIGSPFPGSMYGPDHSYAYVIYGGTAFAAATALSTISGSSGIRYIGGFQDQLGRDIAGIGDVNGDGRSDIFIESWYEASIGISGQPIYGSLRFGPPNAAVDPVVGWQITEGHGFPIRDVEADAAGDFNGDGIDDFIITLVEDESYQYGYTTANGERINAIATVVFGRTGGWEGVTNGLNANRGFVALGLGDGGNASVSTLGDFNGDGLDDVAVGHGNAAYVIFGSRSLPFSLDIRNLAPDQGLMITDVGTNPKVAGAGDVNGDGISDLAITSALGSWVVLGGINNPPTGGPGDDVLTGTSSPDTLIGAGGNDALRGLGGSDVLRGDDGNDVLDGGSGNDRMEGGAGSDVFYVDSSLDIVVDPVGDGTDRVATSVSFTLDGAADIEILEAVDTFGLDAINLTGNNYAQAIAGNFGANFLRGGGGPDALMGLGGNDVLWGEDGVDALHGGTGDDIYYADASDQIFEWRGEGRDRVAALSSLSLAAGVEIEVLEAITSTATTAIDLFGNEFSNVIAGNAGANTLDGGGGNDYLVGLGGADTLRGGSGDDMLEGGLGIDVMHGGAGSDTFYVDSDYDEVVDPVGDGVDRVAVAGSYTLAAGADIEILEAITLSETAIMSLIGNEFGTMIIGNSGANTLDGKGGNDILIGARGADTFAFTSQLGASNVDRIEVFESGIDKIALSTAIFDTIAPGSIAAGAFTTGPSASDGDDRIIFNRQTGALYYDSDGIGAAAMVQFAVLEPQTSLTASDFFLI